MVIKLTFFPAKFEKDALLLRTDQGVMYINTGSFSIPDYTVLADSSAVPTFIGTGAEIDALTPVIGQEAYCTVSGLGFLIDKTYKRNAANTKWLEDGNPSAGQTVFPHSTTIADYESPTAGGGSFEAPVVTNVVIANGGFTTAPNLTSAVDDDFNTNTVGGLNGSGREAAQQYDYGKIATRKIRIKVGYSSGGGGPGDVHTEYSSNGTTWTLIAEALAFTQGSLLFLDNTITATFRYTRIRSKHISGLGQININHYESEQMRQRRLVDNDTTTQWASANKVNPDGFGDLGSEKIVGAVAIFFSNDTDETQFKIRVSKDTTFTDAETVRIINFSDLVDGVYNYIRFNPKEGRYIQIFGNSGVTHKIFIDELKILTKTVGQAAADHGHFPIDSTDVTLALDGT